jgi:hypothetical protein
MKIRELFVMQITAIVFACAAFAQTPTAGTKSKPIEVMVVGMYHMSNPGHDLHDAKSDDVLQPARQIELDKLTDRINGFHPTKVGVEWDASEVKERYPRFLSGKLAPSYNEVVQVGFRLAQKASAEVYGLDADGEFPWQRLENYANAYGFKQLLSPPGWGDDLELQRRIDHEGIISALWYLNQPEHIRRENGGYRSLLRIGSGADQPGADLLAAWQHRNLLICSNLLQVAEPGDRIVVFFGAGHAYLLRQCVEETPGLVLVDPLPIIGRK